ncbi:SRPBCC domain-containing protein [Cellulomonas cellasea]|uniref:Polyketide cyclase n=1 Tax=Cellulomonas cellasea TaxID=43670 RepID=A0A4Y3KQP5_9CELL|nr:SRPBCC domain-containing protein [Cellulomonas cellasea]GEA86382.1 hypothetical protein CCE01nite_03310 [Cellulomonas cellasea]
MNPFACTLHAELDVDASAEEVWAVLVDHAAYPRWNPVVVRVRGELRVGARAVETVRTDRGRELTFRSRVLVVDRPHELVRRGRLLLPGVFTGVHRYRLDARGGGVRVVQSERLTGVLVPFLRRRLTTQSQAQFRAVNAALARRVAELRGAATDPEPHVEQRAVPAPRAE